MHDNEPEHHKIISRSIHWSIWSIPCLLSFFLGVYCFGSDALIHGEFLYDDRRSCGPDNDCLDPRVPFFESCIWSKDFWGFHDIDDADSHKSYRPITSLSYRINYMLQLAVAADLSGETTVFGTKVREITSTFHIVNAILHGIVSALVVLCANSILHPVTAYPYLRLVSCLGAGLLFASHPVHSEAVANTTGRADVLCALFYCTGFLLYVISVRGFYRNIEFNGLKKHCWTFFGLLSVGVFTLLSLLSKEHGMTLPVTCVIWESICVHRKSCRGIVKATFCTKVENEKNTENKKQPSFTKNIQYFCLRSILLMLTICPILVWRFRLNGGNPAFIREDQNPAAFHDKFHVRTLSYAWIWCCHIWFLLCPVSLCPEWSYGIVALIGERIPTFSWDDIIPYCSIFVLYALLAHIIWHLVFVSAERSTSDTTNDTGKCYGLLFSFAWIVVTFLPSSNLLVTVGFVLAERVVYLPSIGFSILQCIIYNSIVQYAIAKRREQICILASALLFVLIGVYTKLCIDQANLWSNGVSIWSQAYNLNPNSKQVAHNLGLQLTNHNRQAEAVKIFELENTRFPESKKDLTWQIGSAYAYAGVGDRNKCFQRGVRSLSIIGEEITTEFHELTSGTITKQKKLNFSPIVLLQMSECANSLKEKAAYFMATIESSKILQNFPKPLSSKLEFLTQQLLAAWKDNVDPLSVVVQTKVVNGAFRSEYSIDEDVQIRWHPLLHKWFPWSPDEVADKFVKHIELENRM